MVDVLTTYSKKVNLRERLRRLDDQLATSQPRIPRPAPKRRLKQHLTSEQIAELVRRYNDGATSIQLCAETGMSKQTILKLLHANRAAMRRQGLSPDDAEHAAHLYRAGQSLATIGSELNVNDMTVRAALVKQGVAMRGPHEWEQVPG